jgi:hypothetical protein
MKSKFVAAICLLLVGSQLHSAEPVKEDRKSISVDALNELKIIGKLGIPLGHAVKMKAIVIADGSLRSKAGRSYCLKITSVADKDLAIPVTMPFQDPGGFSLPNELEGLYRMKKGKEAKEMTVEIMEEVEENYVGSEIEFLGFETTAVQNSH